MMKDLYYLDNNAQIMKQQYENVSDYKTSEEQHVRNKGRGQQLGT